MDVDETDKKIINILVENSRLSYRQIAKKAKISVVTVMNRVKKLEKEGIIKKYTALVDYEKLNYGFFVMTSIRISKGKELEVEQALTKYENVFAIYDVTGDFDIEVIAKFKNRAALDSFVKKIQTFEYVERLHTRLILNTIKEEPIKIS